MMLYRIKHMLVKELSQALRNKRMRFFIFVPPLIQLMLFGYVATLDVNNVTTAFIDRDNTSQSRELARRLEASGYFTIRYRPVSEADVRELFDHGTVMAAVQVQPGFGRDVSMGRQAQVQLIMDGSDSNTAIIAMGYAARIISKYGQDLAAPVRLAPPAEFRPRFWYNPDLRSRNFFVPGVIASIITLSCIMLTSMAVVREREVGTMEQLMVTPIQPVEILLGKTAPFAIIAFIQMMLVTVVGVFWFGIPIKGALPLLFIGTACYLLSVLGIGLLLSTIAQTQQQALMAANLFFMPSLLLSGMTFPIENMPRLFQIITLANPMRYFLVVIRGVFLKGVGLDILWPQYAGMLAMGAIIMAVSVMRFHKRLA